MKISAQKLQEQASGNADFKRGCIVDTNVLFAAAYDMDPFHEWANVLFGELRKADILPFTNLNIRFEFIELNRRVFITEGLMDFYTDWGGLIDLTLSSKLKSLKTRITDALKEKRVFKISDHEIKLYKKLLNENAEARGTPSWKMFCINYFAPYIEVVWDVTASELNIQFLGAHEIEGVAHFDGRPTWEEMLSILGKSGVGTSDAMIINLFLKSKLSLIATADLDVRDAVFDLAPPSKYVLAPN